MVNLSIYDKIYVLTMVKTVLTMQMIQSFEINPLVGTPHTVVHTVEKSQSQNLKNSNLPIYFHLI